MIKFHQIYQRRFRKIMKVKLPFKKVVIEKIKAEMKNGVLSIEIPKIEPKKIEIN